MAAEPHPTRRPIPWPGLISLALTVLLAFALARQLPAGHLTNTDELFTAERAREISFSGPGTMWDNFRPIFRKAPLQYWLTAVSLALWPGTPEAAVRLPVLLYALGTAGLVAALARSVRSSSGGWTGALAVGIFALCPLTLVEGSRALLDMGLTFWTTAVLLAAQRARTVPGWWLLAGAAAAGGSLQKIPLPAGALVVIVGLRLLSAAGRAGLRADRGPLVAGLVLAAVGTAFWPLWQAGFHAMPTRGAFALDEAGELLGNTRLGARSGWEVLDRLIFRWTWGPFALAAAFGLAFRRVRTWWHGEPVAPAAEVAVVCLGIVLAATLTGFRSVRYVLPAVPGLCLLAAVVMAGLCERPGKQRVAAGAAAAVFFVLGIPPAWHKVATLPPAAPDQHALAVALGNWRQPGEAAVLVREPEDAKGADGVLREEFYLFYGNLRAPVRSVTRREWQTWTPPDGGALGVCRAVDFERVRERLPGMEVRLAKGAFVLWGTKGKAEGRRLKAEG